MSGRWFANRGQMVQVTCAVIAVGLGIITQWNQISTAIDFGLVIKILLYPLVAVGLVQLGKYFPTRATPTPVGKVTGPPIAEPPISEKQKWNIDYQFLTPTVKVGSYFNVNQQL